MDGKTQRDLKRDWFLLGKINVILAPPFLLHTGQTKSRGGHMALSVNEMNISFMLALEKFVASSTFNNHIKAMSEIQLLSSNCFKY